jgi:lysophospholipase L1-like esterase
MTPWRRRLGVILSALALSLVMLPGVSAGATDPAPQPAAETQPGATSAAGPWDDPGPYGVKVRITLTHTFYYPDAMGDGGRTHPVIIWGNGTGTIPGVYSGLLRHWAGQGFIVAAANTPNPNFGVLMLRGIDTLTSWNADPRSEFHQRVDLAGIGASGHSQGGSGAINAGADRRVKTVAPIQPGPLNSPSALRGPALFLAGERDLIVPPVLVRGLYGAADQVPAVYAELRGARHVSAVGDAGGFRGVTTAWFRYHLMGDAAAGALFFGPHCGLCGDPAWSDVRRNSRATAQPAPATSTSTQAAATRAAARSSDNVRYVALGDSAAAGPLILPPDLRQPGCLRTTRNWPTLTARTLGVAEFTDATCSSARTTDLAGSQSTPLGPVPPQLDALDADTTLVTVQLGANDISLSSVIGDCLNPLRPPLGKHCADGYRADGRDLFQQRTADIAPRIDRMIDDIRARAPRAEVYVVGYGSYLPPGGCHPVVPILPRDATYIQQTFGHLNTMLERRATARGAHFVDLAAGSAGHDVCRPPGTRWIEPYLPASPAAPFHPNARGMAGFADIVTAAVTAGATAV